MTMKPGLSLLMFMAAMALTGCDLFEPKPENEAVTTVPAPPGNGPINAYADDAGVSLQSRPGDCARAACFQFARGKWRPMPRVSVATLPLLAVAAATGSSYSDALWHRIGPSGPAVLINRQAGAYNIAAGRFDGLRIGLRQDTGIRYAVAYSVETGDFLTAHGRCAASQPASGMRAADCAKKVAENLYIAMPDAEVVTSGNKAWLLHRRADGSANLVDLFAASAQTDPELCVPGRHLDSAPAGDYKAALSPDMFVSRVVDPSSSDRNKLLCFTQKSKP